MTNALEQWQEEAQKSSPISTEMLDKIGKEYKEKWDEIEALELKVKKLKEVGNEVEAKMSEALTQAGKEKYYVEGVGTFGFAERTTVQTPKTDAEKQAIAKYLENKGGKQLFWSLFGINSNTLQSFYKGEQEEYKMQAKEAAERGEVLPAFYVPGVGAPVTTKKIRLTSERSK